MKKDIIGIIKTIILNFVREYFVIPRNDAQEEEAVMDIRKGIEFKGSTFWVLICAIFIASLGLNVNSTAVIIGAMLISPLMGPIIGMGFSIGIYDFDLLKRSFKNFVVVTTFSILTATVYFLLTPLDTAQSEILARTSPTFYDVCIALMGGMAGIVAIGARDKGNVVPGVAIATALMPPLCTAGFGIATGHWQYAFGALYLFFINFVFIGLATYLGVMLMKFKKVQQINKKNLQKLHRYVTLIILVAVCPAIFFTIHIVRETLYVTEASNFIANEIGRLEHTLVLDKTISFKEKNIKVVLMGSETTEDEIRLIKSHMSDYRLGETTLTVVQGEQKAQDVNSLRAMLLEDFYKNSEEKIQHQQEQIMALEQELEGYRSAGYIGRQVASEMDVLFPSVKSISLSNAVRYVTGTNEVDTCVMVIAVMQRADSLELAKLNDWLKLRIGTDRMELHLQTEE